MPLFQEIGVIGLGMIGGSVALDVRKAGVAKRIIAASRRRSTLEKAKRAGLIDQAVCNSKSIFEKADFVVLATPPSVVSHYLEIMAKTNPSLLVTDVSSVKGKIVQAANKILGRKHSFVGSHPIAGSEQSGLEAAQPNLFQGKTVVVTPARKNQEESVRKVVAFWSCLGARVKLLGPNEHDYLLAATSHLPHLIVYALLDTAMKVKSPLFQSCAGTGF
ncbi:MAG: prephenate dehydrogenase/arogenate dehydrogenase family protein, partial [Candidatus Omnitrophica bacterium]|nr:prephenate dehydrogenase/arogenate dehydrogenase family protein [Candidatus Omnitrophota bacterium]